MKHLISILILCLLVSSCKNEEKQTVERDGYYITGTATGVYNGMRAYLESTNSQGRKVAIDTAIVMNEKFVFDGKIDYPEMLYLTINNVKGSLPLIVENKEISIVVNKDNFSTSSIVGTKSNELLNLYNKETVELNRQRLQLNNDLRLKKQQDPNFNSEELSTSIEDLRSRLTDYPFEFAKKHKDNVFSVLLLNNLLNNKTTDYTKLKTAYDNLDLNQKNSINGVMLNTQLQIKKSERAAVQATEIGQAAPSFTAPTPDGKQLALHDVKGKLTLIDFWASWCKPCRRENPNVVNVYQKYHKKGLEIISVSLDGSKNQKDPKAAWLKAINDDNLTWSHVSNLSYFNDPVAKAYNIRSIPATFLLDQDGKIVAKNLRGAALEQKVAEYLN